MSGPWRGPPMPSLGSTPGGDSILMTSAPKSANCLTQVGPARTLDRSRTRKRDSAADAAILGMREYSSGACVWLMFQLGGGQHEKNHDMGFRGDRRIDAGGLRRRARFD